ncbi:MAG: RNA polymerase sigma factor [Candidatus Poribacteria bacterium]|nr:RNA polymerase sigma factor [Candidatus Poribacteria bacterium]MDE0504481.1 RNA polymerase sigma factor [Candidatus Poribacteria bacterium]
MENLEVETLVRLCSQQNERAFAELVRRHEQQLVAQIRYQLGNNDHVDDVLQETLIQAWLGIRHLREPKAVRRWLLQIARNRCFDFLKSAQRRDLPVESDELTQFVDRFGHKHIRQRQMVDDAVEALAHAPEDQREVAQMFYLEGFSVSEIAARRRCPEGTVKQRLFHARVYLRESFGISRKEKTVPASLDRLDTKKQSFPVRRPEVVITKINGDPFSVDRPELRWWFIIPVIGERSQFADYESTTWELSKAHDIRTVRAAVVHDVDGIEIEIHTWEPEYGWSPSTWEMCGRLTETTTEYLAVSLFDDDKRILNTFLDEGFDFDWGQMPRKLEDRGYFSTQADGSPRQIKNVESMEASGAGIFSVSVGERNFTCLRVFQLEALPTALDATITESYVTESGRTIMVRHFRRPETAMSGETQSIAADYRLRHIIDGVEYYHWYDSISNLVFGF